MYNEYHSFVFKRYWSQRRTKTKKIISLPRDRFNTYCSEMNEKITNNVDDLCIYLFIILLVSGKQDYILSELSRSIEVDICVNYSLHTCKY